MKRQIGDLLEKNIDTNKNKALWKDFLGGMGFFFKRGTFSFCLRKIYFWKCFAFS